MPVPDGNFVYELADKLYRPVEINAPDGPAVVVPSGWKRLEERPLSAPAPLQVNTLQGIVDYLDHNVDKLDLEKVMVHVASPTKVRVLNQLEPEEQRFRRYGLMEAVAIVNNFNYGVWMRQEEFLIAVQTHFAGGAGRDELVRVASQVKAGSTITQADDGFTQEVEVKKGVTLAQRAAIKNPIILAPYRTFSEVDQPTSPFIFRVNTVNDTPSFSLHQVASVEWFSVANGLIAAWLKENLDDSIAVIG